MGTEIERKFLVAGNEWRDGNKPVHTCQGYLFSGSDCTVRIRLMDEQAYLTIKGRSRGITRLEYEYQIPAADAKEILDRLCMQPRIEKNRYTVTYAGTKWEVDEFLEENEGLIVAEVELQDEGEAVELPPWVSEEVSRDPKYSNFSLVKQPYSRWDKRPS